MEGKNEMDSKILKEIRKHYKQEVSEFDCGTYIEECPEKTVSEGV